MRHRNTLILFARAPRICRVKTRMWPALTHRECLYLHRQSIRSMMDKFRHKFNIVFYTTDMTHFPVQTRLQHGLDLGVRMYHAMNDELKVSEKAILIGSDCPQLDENYIKQAFAALECPRDIVLGPANDGGYFLIGAKRVSPLLFKNISWGQATVLKETLSVIDKLGLRPKMFDPLIDIDTIDDLKALRDLNSLPDWANQLV